jgi:hypothetical protein
MRRRECLAGGLLAVVLTFALLAEPVFAQDKVFPVIQDKVIPVKLRNGCALDLPLRFDANSVALMRQDLMPANCPASGRYTGMVSLGMSIHVVFTNSERHYFQVRSGKVLDGKFEYFLTQNEVPWQGLVWEDSAGNKISVEIPRDVGGDGLNGARRQLTSALASRESPNIDNAARDFLAQRLLDGSRGYTTHLQRFASGEQSRFPASFAGGANDDPKARGRSARGG